MTTTYELHTDDGAADVTLDANSMQEAEAIADALLREWATDTPATETAWMHATAVELTDGEQTDATDIVVEVEPPEPPCTDSQTEHDWQSPHALVGGLDENPGVWGHGGGVTVHEACVRCGCGRVTDTWAQDRATGEQGLTSVSYAAGEYTERLGAVE